MVVGGREVQPRSCEMLENTMGSTQSTQVNSPGLPRGHPVLLTIPEYVNIFEYICRALPVLELICSLRVCADPVCSGPKWSSCREKPPSGLKWTCESSAEPSRRSETRRSSRKSCYEKTGQDTESVCQTKMNLFPPERRRCSADGDKRVSVLDETVQRFRILVRGHLRQTPPRDPVSPAPPGASG